VSFVISPLCFILEIITIYTVENTPSDYIEKTLAKMVNINAINEHSNAIRRNEHIYTDTAFLRLY